jgi:hypothetical protein
MAILTRLRIIYFVSRRGAEIAEAAENSEPQGLGLSAHSAISAPLREIISALRAGAVV